MKIKLGFMLSAAAISVAGCMSTSTVKDATVILSCNTCTVDLPKAAIQPTIAEMQGERAKVVVLPIINESSQSFESGAARGLLAKMDSALNSVGVDTLDRKLANRLGDEIVAYEQSGEFSGAGINLAGFAIQPKITNVQLGGKYSAPKYVEKDGKSVYVAASCNYSGEVMGSVKVYKLPDLTIVDQINIDGNASQSTETKGSNCPIGQSTATALVSSAAQDGIFPTLPDVQKHFVQNAYVIGYRKMDDQHIVQISMGSNQGLKEGQTIEFVRQQKDTNPITGQVTITQIPFEFEGTVTQINQGDMAWINVDDEAEGLLQFGDIAHQKFEIGLKEIYCEKVKFGC